MWSQKLTPSYVRSLRNNTDTSRDTELLTYINAIIRQIERVTDIDFNFTNATVTETYKNTLADRRFVLRDPKGNSPLVQIGAWQSVAQVRVAEVKAPVWQTVEYLTRQFSVNPYPIYQIELYEPLRRGQQIEVTGVQGFGDEFTIPDDIEFIFAESVDAYFRFIENGSEVVQQEKDLTSTIVYGENPLNSLQIFNPHKIMQFEEILKNYKVIPDYPR